MGCGTGRETWTGAMRFGVWEVGGGLTEKKQQIHQPESIGLKFCRLSSYRDVGQNQHESHVATRDKPGAKLSLQNEHGLLPTVARKSYIHRTG